MNSFNKGGSFGRNRDRNDEGRDRGRFNNNNRNYDDRSSDRPMMYKAVCDECGNSCQVPFKPTGSKPIYCSNCFEKHGNDDYGNKNSNNSGYVDKQMFSAICDKCGKKCEVPFKPSGDKPVYCSDCFEDKGHVTNRSNSFNDGGRDSSNEDVKRQLKDINEKLDAILLALKKD